jgi:hypothetical protein
MSIVTNAGRTRLLIRVARSGGQLDLRDMSADEQVMGVDLLKRDMLEATHNCGLPALRWTEHGVVAARAIFAKLDRENRRCDLLDPRIFYAHYPERIRSRITGDGYQVKDPNGVTWTVTSAWTLGNPRDGWKASPGYPNHEVSYRFAIENDISVLVAKVLAGRTESQ